MPVDLIMFIKVSASFMPACAGAAMRVSAASAVKSFMIGVVIGGVVSPGKSMAYQGDMRKSRVMNSSGL